MLGSDRITSELYVTGKCQDCSLTQGSNISHYIGTQWNTAHISHVIWTYPQGFTVNSVGVTLYEDRVPLVICGHCYTNISEHGISFLCPLGFCKAYLRTAVDRAEEQLRQNVCHRNHVQKIELKKPTEILKKH